MINDYVALGIIGVCLIVIALMISKKFPVLSSINFKDLQKHKQDKVKNELIESRLKRKLGALNFRGIFKTKSEKPRSPFISKISSYLSNLEKKYRHKIRENEPEAAEDSMKKVNILISEAKELMEQKKFKEAEDKFIEVISLDNKLDEAYKGLAEAYVEMKDYAHAKETLQYLIKINSEDDTTNGSSGQADTQKDDSKENGVIKSVSLNNEVAGYHVDLGEVYMEAGEHDKAMECFKEAVKLEPNNPRNLDAIIKVAIKIKDAVLAQENLDKLKEVNPDNEKLEEVAKEIALLKK